MIIDFHTHIFSPRIKQNRGKYVAGDACFALLYSSPAARLATAEELIASMDKDGIDIAVVLNIGWTTHQLCVETNDYILESIARYPQRLIGFGSVPPYPLDAALDEIERCAEGGIRGIGEIRWVWDISWAAIKDAGLRQDIPWLDLRNEGMVKPVIETIVRHNLILLTHASEPAGHQYPGKGAITPEILYPLITGFPALTLVCAHWGGGLPFYALMPEVKKAMSNVFFDTAASPLLYSSQVYKQVMQLVGADKILFGSDYPLLAPSRLLKEIKSLDLPAATERLILAGNAQRLLGIKSSDRA